MKTLDRGNITGSAQFTNCTVFDGIRITFEQIDIFLKFFNPSILRSYGSK